MRRSLNASKLRQMSRTIEHILTQCIVESLYLGIVSKQMLSPEKAHTGHSVGATRLLNLVDYHIHIPLRVNELIGSNKDPADS